MRFVPKISPAWAGRSIVALALVCVQSGMAQDAADRTQPAEMKPYTETIPGTAVEFEMMPIPGGTLKLRLSMSRRSP